MFSTTSKTTGLHGGIKQSPPRSTSKVGQKLTAPGTTSQKLKKERWQAVGILLLFGIVIGVLLYLASMSGLTYPGGNTGYGFWMMP